MHTPLVLYILAGRIGVIRIALTLVGSWAPLSLSFDPETPKFHDIFWLLSAYTSFPDGYLCKRLC